MNLPVDPALVRPLRQAQNEFVQVLLTRFELTRHEQGLALDVAFDYETPAIWTRRGKAHIGDLLDASKMAGCRRTVREALLGQSVPSLIYDDPVFPFRFGNGGALPVVRMDGQDYYCLFYRGVNPVGWNIANGGAESAAELLDPLATIERELREELIIVDPAQGSRYVFDWSEGRRPDHPEFAVARTIWETIFRRADFPELQELPLPLKWLCGHDTVTIRCGEHEPVVVRDCLVNINAEDFGIEIDRVAKIAVGPNAIFCDGEVVRGKLPNRPVGLFRVHGFHQAMAAETAFRPDRLFWNGRDRSGDRLEDVVRESFEDLRRRRVFAFEPESEWHAAPSPYGLCPVTDVVVRRYLRLGDSVPPPLPPRAPAASGRFDVFLSFNSECRELAQEVFESLRAGGRRVFFSDQTLHQSDFAEEIDAALESARALVVVGRRARHFKTGWVEYEWRTFHQDILNRRKPKRAPMVTITEEPKLYLLPRPLANKQVLRWDASGAGMLAQLLGAPV